MTRFERQATSRVATALLASWLYIGVSAFAQDEPVPKPKPKPATSASKPATKAAPSSGATLLVMCDLACSWKLDGEAKGTIPADGSAKARVELGQHSISATTPDGPDQLRQDVDIKQTGQTVVHMDISPVRATRIQREKDEAARAELAERVDEQSRLQQDNEERARKDQKAKQEEEDPTKVWTDPATGLIWTKQDNGINVTWREAAEYCQNLQWAGKRDWRLPTIAELKDIYDANGSIPGECCDGRKVTWRSKGNLSLSGWQWSSSQASSSDKLWWWFNFTDGTRSASMLIGGNKNARALCVRGPRP